MGRLRHELSVAVVDRWVCCGKGRLNGCFYELGVSRVVRGGLLDREGNGTGRGLCKDYRGAGKCLWVLEVTFP